MSEYDMMQYEVIRMVYNHYEDAEYLAYLAWFIKVYNGNEWDSILLEIQTGYPF
jgi:hypothetical protein